MILKKDKIPALLDALCTQARVFVPQNVSGVTKFASYQQGTTPLLDETNTLMPPKDLLFPQAEKLYHYGENANGDMFINPIVESNEQILFGVRPCDMRSIECLDDVFLTKGYQDQFYSDKRAKLITVCIGCTHPKETCFCDSMGLDPNEAPNADIQLRDAGDAYTVAAQTAQGTEVLKAWQPFLEEDDATTAASTENGTATAAAPEPVKVSCTLKVNAAGIKEKLDKVGTDDALWNDLSVKCLTCGTCTFICPTCYCFDIDQENRCKEGVRFRCWDSCMFSEYTEMAGGHNPRPQKKDRVRNRFMHKLNFFEGRYGKTLCVGCGRCVEKCPVALDITVLIDQIGAMDA